MKCKQAIFTVLTIALLSLSMSSAFASVTIPKRPIFFPFNNGAYLTFSTSILPLTFSSVYRDTANRWHFGNIWLTSTTDMTITAWFSSDWLNYTVPSSGTQQISNGSKPTNVFLDGVNKIKGDGWSYSGTTVTVTGATTSAQLYWGSGGPRPVTIIGGGPTVTFTVYYQGKILQGIRVQVFTVPLYEYVGSYVTGSDGSAQAQLDTGYYAYNATYGQFKGSGEFQVKADDLSLTVNLSQSEKPSLKLNQLVWVAIGFALIVLLCVAVALARPKF